MTYLILEDLSEVRLQLCGEVLVDLIGGPVLGIRNSFVYRDVVEGVLQTVLGHVFRLRLSSSGWGWRF